MAENEPRHLHQLAGMLHPYSINRVREVLLDWLRDGHDAAREKRRCGARGTGRFVKDHHARLVETASSLRYRLAELQAEPRSLLLTIESSGVSLYPFRVHRGPEDPLPTPDHTYTRTFLSDLPKPLDCLVLLPWADIAGEGQIRLWAGGGELSGSTVNWNWLVSLTNEVPEIPAQATYPSRVHRRPERDQDTEEHRDSLADNDP